jgi:hypothetical protein
MTHQKPTRCWLFQIPSLNCDRKCAPRVNVFCIGISFPAIPTWEKQWPYHADYSCVQYYETQVSSYINGSAVFTAEKTSNPLTVNAAWRRKKAFFHQFFLKNLRKHRRINPPSASIWHQESRTSTGFYGACREILFQAEIFNLKIPQIFFSFTAKRYQELPTDPHTAGINLNQYSTCTNSYVLAGVRWAGPWHCSVLTASDDSSLLKL